MCDKHDFDHFYDDYIDKCVEAGYDTLSDSDT